MPFRAEQEAAFCSLLSYVVKLIGSAVGPVGIFFFVCPTSLRVALRLVAKANPVGRKDPQVLLFPWVGLCEIRGKLSKDDHRYVTQTTLQVCSFCFKAKKRANFRFESEIF